MYKEAVDFSEYDKGFLICIWNNWILNDDPPKTEMSELSVVD